MTLKVSALFVEARNEKPVGITIGIKEGADTVLTLAFAAATVPLGVTAGIGSS